MKYILIATKGDTIKTSVLKEQETILLKSTIEQLKLLGYSIKVYYGHELNEYHYGNE